jgi:hypothetical protein
MNVFSSAGDGLRPFPASPIYGGVL